MADAELQWYVLIFVGSNVFFFSHLLLNVPQSTHFCRFFYLCFVIVTNLCAVTVHCETQREKLSKQSNFEFRCEDNLHDMGHLLYRFLSNL